MELFVLFIILTDYNFSAFLTITTSITINTMNTMPPIFAHITILVTLTPFLISTFTTIIALTTSYSCL